MYRFLDRLDPDDVQAIAAQAFVEMLEGGFTALAEFHYLHHDKDGRAYANIATMGQAIASAAQETGLGLTLLPVLYRFGNFGQAPSVHGQRRFVNERDAYQRLLEGSLAAIRDLPDARLGVAPHSLRAVALDDLGWVSSLRPNDPVHIHVAEQVPEVEASLKITGKRPVELLMDAIPLDKRWCLIHATHLSDAERDGIARSGAVAGLCPITESSLGDGIFDGIRYAQAGGAYGVGSDSNIQIDAGSELRQLEYSQRLRDRRRALFAEEKASTGLALWQAACAGGARACGRAIGAIAPGHRADSLVRAQGNVRRDGRGDDSRGAEGSAHGAPAVRLPFSPPEARRRVEVHARSLGTASVERRLRAQDDLRPDAAAARPAEEQSA